MENKTVLSYKFSRVPQITTATFQTQSDSSDPSIIKSRDQLEEELKMWYMMFVDKIRKRGTMSVAELRRKAGLDISLEDYLFGFDEDCLSYTGNHGLEVIKFHPIHLKQILEPNYKSIDFEDLAEVSATDAEYEQAFLQYADVTNDVVPNYSIRKYIMKHSD